MTNVPLQLMVPKMQIPLKYIENSFKYIGSLDDLRTRGRSPGEICIYKGMEYVWVNDKWESLEYVPSTPSSPKKINPMFCSQCGASLHGSICKYCGTEYR